MAVLLSLGTGVMLTAIGHRFGPVAVVLVPLVMVLASLAVVRPLVALLTVVVLLPAGAVALPAGLQVVDVTVAAAIGATAVGRMLQGRAPLPLARLVWWPFAILGLAVVSAVMAVDPGVAVQRLPPLLVGALLVLVVVAVVPDVATMRRVVLVLALVGGGLAVQGATGVADLQSRVGTALDVGNRPTGIFTSPNQLGALAGMSVLLGMGLAVGATRKTHRVVGGTVVLAGGAGLIATLSRGAWLGTGIALLGFFLLAPSVRQTWLRLGLPLAVLAGVVGGLVLPTSSPQVEIIRGRIETLAEAETSPYDSRPDIWAEAIGQIRDAPLIGQGPGNFSVGARRGASDVATVRPMHAHNAVLQLAAEHGIPGVLLVAGFAVALVAGALRSVRQADSAERTLVVGVVGALVVQMVHGSVDYTLTHPVVATATWMVAGLLVATDERHR